MANTQSGNTFYVDSASSASTAQSFIQRAPTLVTEIILTSNAAGDTVVICDVAPGTTPSQGNNKITLSSGVAKDSKTVRFYDQAIVFPNGVWIASISSGATCTLLTTNQGSG